MKLSAILMGLFFLSNVYASVDIGKCGGINGMWSEVTSAGNDSDFVNPANSTFTIENGKIKINKPENIVSKDVSDTK